VLIRMDSNHFGKPGPDPQQSEKQDPHQSQKADPHPPDVKTPRIKAQMEPWRAVDAHSVGVEPQKEPWRVVSCRIRIRIRIKGKKVDPNLDGSATLEIGI
jgi:hypothetical protein